MNGCVMIKILNLVHKCSLTPTVSSQCSTWSYRLFKCIICINALYTWTSIFVHMHRPTHLYTQLHVWGVLMAYCCVCRVSLVASHEDQLAAITSLCKQEMKLLLNAKKVVPRVSIQAG